MSRFFGPDTVDLPLSGVRVIDLTDDRGATCGRLLADLGADVLLIEPPGGAQSRCTPPVVDGTSLSFATRHANKRSAVIDWTDPAGREALLGLAAAAEIVIDGLAPGQLDEAGLSASTLLAHNPQLVVTSITPFGQTGPYRDWVATDWTHLALASVLARSGNPAQPPLMPPGRLADEHAGVQAAWATLVAYWKAVHTGTGEHVDLSVLEAVVQSLDPAFGMAGTAMSGATASDLPAGRPDARHMYPIFAAADGHVRICVLAKRQWRGLYSWLGEPPEFADPKYNSTARRFRDAARIHAVVAAMFRTKSTQQLLDEGTQYGVPVETVNSATNVLSNPHFAARRSWVDVDLHHGGTARVPRGFLEIDSAPAGLRHPAPVIADSRAAFDVPPERAAWPVADASAPPLSGLRVLDLGVIVVGGETGRLFADLGADVIKIESSSFPDGARQSGADGISASFAWGHRGKRSLGIDLRSAEGTELFLCLVAQSDLVLSNFKPGTLESLGIGYDTLKEVNPGIVVIDSSALGNSGPAARRLGYGPLVRAVCGITRLWRYPEDSEGFCDSITVYPDHIAGRIGAVAALANLIRRGRTGSGGTASVTQAEVILSQFAGQFALESLTPGSTVAQGNTGDTDAPWGVYPCAGDDQWCVVTVTGTEQFSSLCRALDATDLAVDASLATASGRLLHRERIEARLTEWTQARSPLEVMTTLQSVCVAAAAMLRPSDLLVDPHLMARNTFAELHQPQLGPLPAERSPATFSTIADPPLRPAPRQGEHTREIAAELLGLSQSEIEKVIDRGVLEVPEDHSKRNRPPIS